VKYSLLFHCNNGCTNVPQCYVIRTLPVLLNVCFHMVRKKHRKNSLSAREQKYVADTQPTGKRTNYMIKLLLE